MGLVSIPSDGSHCLDVLIKSQTLTVLALFPDTATMTDPVMNKQLFNAHLTAILCRVDLNIENMHWQSRFIPQERSDRRQLSSTVSCCSLSEGGGKHFEHLFTPPFHNITRPNEQKTSQLLHCYSEHPREVRRAACQPSQETDVRLDLCAAKKAGKRRVRQCLRTPGGVTVIARSRTYRGRKSKSLRWMRMSDWFFPRVDSGHHRGVLLRGRTDGRLRADTRCVSTRG